DESSWSVLPDWEAKEGLIHDLFTVTESNESSGLRTCFQDNPYFLQIIDYLQGNTGIWNI
ncbi:hypothetical protein M422DRAFT_182915, partial [Sphaerobolus stellatus SS14]